MNRRQPDLVSSFFESRGQGHFNLLNLSLTVTNPLPKIDPAWRALSEEVRLDKWMNATSYYHELRHFHDLVGSVSGYHLMLEATALVDNFYVSLRREQASSLCVPLCKQHQDIETVKAYETHIQFLRTILGDLPLETAPDDIGREFPVRSFSFTVPAVQTGLPFVPCPRLDPRTGTEKEVLVPLGLRALMEHVAIEVQVFLSAIGATDVPDSTADAMGQVRRARELWARLFRSEDYQYIVTYVMANYGILVSGATWFELTPDVVMPGIGELSPVAVAAMDLGGYVRVRQSVGQTWEFEHPGLAFAHLLFEWLKQPPERDFPAVLNRITRAQPMIGIEYTEFIKRYTDAILNPRSDHLPAHLTPAQAVDPMIAELRRFLAKQHRQLMTLKRDQLDKWLVPDAYVRGLEAFPQAPFVQAGERIEVADLERGEVISLLRWNVALAVMEGIAETGMVRCPILDKIPSVGQLLSFLDPQDPTRSTTCLPFVQDQRCGTFDGRFKDTQPTCHFVDLVERILKQLHFELNFDDGRQTA